MNMGTPMPEEKKPAGAIISIIVIVLVIALGAYYFLKQVPLSEEGALTPSETQSDASISNLSTQGTSSDIVDIQKDLDATNLNNLDSGLSNVAI